MFLRNVKQEKMTLFACVCAWTQLSVTNVWVTGTAKLVIDYLFYPFLSVEGHAAPDVNIWTGYNTKLDIFYRTCPHIDTFSIRRLLDIVPNRVAFCAICMVIVGMGRRKRKSKTRNKTV